MRLTDHAGNEKYLSSDGIVIDGTSPTVPIVDTGSSISGTWTNSNVTFNVSGAYALSGIAKYQYSTDGGSSWLDMDETMLTVSAESQTTDGVSYIFRAVSNSGVPGNESEEFVVKIDKTKPDGDITIEENSVKKLINEVMFGQLFNKNVDVEITAVDAGSGVKSIEYYRSTEILTEQQLKNVTEWVEYKSVIIENAQDAEKFIYYVKITDNAGNSAWFASNGTTFDMASPVISGVLNSGIYYTTRKVYVTDDNLDSVTVNGSPAEKEIVLAGNVNKEYIIAATDKAGNETLVIVSMRETDSLKEEIEDITPDTAVSGDRKIIKEYLNDLKKRLEDVNITDEEKEILQQLADEAQALFDKLSDTVIEIVCYPGAPAVTAEIPDNAIELTEEEQDEIDAGNDLTIIISVKNADDTVSAEDKAAIEAKFEEAVENGVAGQCLDITLLKKIGDAEAENVVSTIFPAKISITIPESMKNTDTSKSRTYDIIRVHEGVAEVIESSFDETEGTITFSTDRFSIYAIVYADTDNTNPDDTETETPSKPDDIQTEEPSGTDNTNPDAQNTGDDSGTGVSTGDTAMRVIIPLIVIMFAAAFVSGFIGISLKKRNVEK